MFSKKGLFLVVIAVIVVTAQGCETLKGAGRGVKKDAENLGMSVQEADDWLQEHLW
jgi:predicted small secreted protein